MFYFSRDEDLSFVYIDESMQLVKRTSSIAVTIHQAGQRIFLYNRCFRFNKCIPENIYDKFLEAIRWRVAAPSIRVGRGCIYRVLLLCSVAPPFAFVGLSGGL